MCLGSKREARPILKDAMRARYCSQWICAFETCKMLLLLPPPRDSTDTDRAILAAPSGLRVSQRGCVGGSVSTLCPFAGPLTECPSTGVRPKCGEGQASGPHDRFVIHWPTTRAVQDLHALSVAQQLHSLLSNSTSWVYLVCVHDADGMHRGSHRQREGYAWLSQWAAEIR